MAGSDDLDDYDDYEDAPPAGPKPQVTILTLALIILNVAAALGFVYLLSMDYQKRQTWSYQVFMADLALQGLPLRMEDDGVSASRVTMPGFRLDSDGLKKAYEERGGKPVTEPFEAAGPSYLPIPAPDKNGSHDYKDGNWVANAARTGNYNLIMVDPSRTPRSFIRASDLTPSILKDLFDDGRLGEPVATLEDEIKRLKETVAKDLDKVADEVAKQAKDPAEKRTLLVNLLLPLTSDGFKVEALARRIGSAADGELDALVKEAAQRRLLYELLAPLEIAKPGDLQYRLLERAADIKGLQVVEKTGDGKFALKDVESLAVTDLVNRVNRRLEAALSDTYFPDVHQGKEWDQKERHSIERRRTIGLILTALSHLRKPDGKLVFPQAAERSEVVLGIPEYALAVQTYAQSWQTLEEQFADAIKTDRRGDGYEATVKDKGGKAFVASQQSFLDKHRAEVQRIRDLADKINQAQERHRIAAEQGKQAKKLYDDRLEHQEVITRKVVEARKETARLAGELRELQRELFQAQVELAEAAEINYRLERDIRKQEKGAKAP